jgi:hypothetical protein
MNKRPKVLIFATVAAAGTVLNTILLIVLLHSAARFARFADVIDRLAGPAGATEAEARAAEARAEEARRAEARVLSDRSNQAAARANYCKDVRKPMLSIGRVGSLDDDLAEQIHVTRDDAERLLVNAGEDWRLGKFSCSPSGTVE